MKKQFLLSVYFRTQGKEQREIILPLQTRMTCGSISALFWHVEASTNSLKLLLGHLLPLVKKFIFIKRSNRILFYCNFLNFAVIFLVTLCKTLSSQKYTCHLFNVNSKENYQKQYLSLIYWSIMLYGTKHSRVD